MCVLFWPPPDFAHLQIVELVPTHANDLFDAVLLFKATLVECLVCALAKIIEFS